MASIDQPDFVDLLDMWLHSHPKYGHLRTTVMSGAGVSDHKIILIKESPAWESYIMTVSVTGRAWRRYVGNPANSFSVQLNPADPHVLEQVENLIRQAFVMKGLL